MWVCSASKVLSSEIQSEDVPAPDPSPDLTCLETRSTVEGKVNRSEGRQLGRRGWRRWKQATIRFQGPVWKIYEVLLAPYVMKGICY